MINKKSNKNIFSLIILIIFILLIILGLAVNLLKNTLWNSNNRFTIAFATDPLIIASFEPRDKNLFLIAFPSNLYLPLWSDYGNNQAYKLWSFSLFEKKDGFLFRKSLENHLGFRIDAYLGLDNKKILKLDNSGEKKDILSFLKTIFSFNNIFSSIFPYSRHYISNISLLDQIKIILFLSNLKGQEISFNDALKSDYHQFSVLPDKNKIVLINSSQFDSFLKDKLSDPEIIFEGPTISILNATGRKGLGSMYGRIAKNTGFQIINLKNTEQKEIKNICLYRDEIKFANSLAFLKKWLDCASIKQKKITADFEIIINNLK